MDISLDLATVRPAFLVLVVSTILVLLLGLSFLLAAALLRRANDRKADRWATLERSWGMFIETIAHGQTGDDALHQRIAPAERLVLVDYLYKAMLHDPRPNRREMYRRLAEPYLDELESRARGGDVWQRARAVRTLGELSTGGHTATIVDALDDDAPHVALTAARVYARLRLGPVQTLLDRIERYQTWDRRLLRSMLTAFGPEAVPALHARLADRTSAPTVRAVCAEALGRFDVDANEAVLAVLVEEDDIDLLSAAMRLLRAPAGATHRAAVRALCGVSDEVIRAQAILCLARVGTAADLQLVENAKDDTSPWVVLNATRGLSARRGDAADVAGDRNEVALMAALTEDGNHAA